MKSDSREIAANAIECSPEIGGFAVGIVENYGRGVELLREASGASETQTLSLRPSRNPCESEIGDKVIVVVESADVAVAAREKHFDNLGFVALERNILKELPRLVAGNGVTRPSHVARQFRRNIKSNRRVNRIPKSKIGDCNAKFVEPCREVPRDKRTAREAEEKYCRRNAILRKRLVIRLEPPPRRAECRSPVHARDLSSEIRAEMSSRPGFKVQLLPRIVHTNVA